MIKKTIIICISRLSEINLKSEEYGTRSINQRKLNLELKEKIRNKEKIKFIEKKKSTLPHAQRMKK